MFEPKVFRKQLCCNEASTYNIVGIFWRPPCDSASGALCPLVTPLPHIYSTCFNFTSLNFHSCRHIGHCWFTCWDCNHFRMQCMWKQWLHCPQTIKTTENYNTKKYLDKHKKQIFTICCGNFNNSKVLNSMTSSIQQHWFSECTLGTKNKTPGNVLICTIIFFKTWFWMGCADNMNRTRAQLS